MSYFHDNKMLSKSKPLHSCSIHMTVCILSLVQTEIFHPLPQESVQQELYCSRCTAPLWRKESWGKRQSSSRGLTEFSQEGGWGLPERWGEKFSHLWVRQAVPLCGKEPVEVVWWMKYPIIFGRFMVPNCSSQLCRYGMGFHGVPSM